MHSLSEELLLTVTISNGNKDNFPGDLKMYKGPTGSCLDLNVSIVVQLMHCNLQDGATPQATGILKELLHNVIV